MSTQQRTNILFPVGRFVMGSLYKPRTTDAEGKPLVIKNGSDAGKPRVDYFIAVAIPKTGVAWHQTDWGQVILAAGAAGFPQAYQSPQFAWSAHPAMPPSAGSELRGLLRGHGRGTADLKRPRRS